jgi:hypothetical protein
VKLPAVAMAVAFLCGIVLGLCPPVALHATSRLFLAAGFFVAGSVGHPSQELLQRLETAGVRVLRTDRDGAIHVLTDGRNLEISCFAGCSLPSGDALRQAQAPDHDKNDQHQ